MMDYSGSQEAFSQSLFRYGSSGSSNENVNMNTMNSDYWSQSSNSQQPDDVATLYSSKPSLFQDSARHVFQQPQNKPFSKTFRHYYETHKRKSTENNQKDILETFINMLKECSTDMKATVDCLKKDIGENLKENVDTIKSVQISETDKILDGVKDELQKTLAHTQEKQEEFTNMKDQLAKKNEEIKVQCERITHLQDEVQSLRLKLETFENKEESIYIEQRNKLDSILGHFSAQSEKFLASKHNEASMATKVTNLSNDLKIIMHQLNNISNSQYKHASVSSMADVMHNPPHYMNAYPTHPSMGFSQPQVFLPNQQSHCNMIPSNDCRTSVQANTAPLSHYSPLQSLPQRLINAPRPSPTAIVTPMVQSKPLKQEEKSPVAGCLLSKKTKESDVFVLSSDSESCQDISDMITNVKKSKLKKKCVTKPNNPTTNQKLATNDVCRPSPVQRSIRRYGKIKKNANRVSPDKVPLNKISGMSKTKNDVTIDKLWKEAVETKNEIPLPPAPKYVKTSRGSLAMQRKQRNVFNFCGDDDDLAELSNLLSMPKKRQQSGPVKLY